MTREEKMARHDWFSRSTTIYAYGVIATMLLFCVLLQPLIIFLGLGTCLFLFLISNTLYSGGKILNNPLRTIAETKEKQSALIDHLGLVVKLVPRHWKFEKKEKTKTSQK